MVYYVSPRVINAWSTIVGPKDKGKTKEEAKKKTKEKIKGSEITWAAEFEKMISKFLELAV